MIMRVKQTKLSVPPVGLRTMKSSASILLCYMVWLLRGKNGIVFYSMLAALWCIRPYREDTLTMAIQRTTGTLTGAVYGLIIILIDQHLLTGSGTVTEVIYMGLVAFTIIPVIHTTVIMNHKNASYFSCVVFLSITVAHIRDASPLLFVANRVLDTMIGIAIGFAVTSFRLPYQKRRDILFVSGADEALIDRNEQLSPYSRVNLNRMLDDGLNFVVSTRRTPASLIEPFHGIRLKLPVIAMGGAVLYDMKEHSFLRTYVISPSTSREVMEYIDKFHLHYFTNVILEDCLIIYYGDFKCPQEEDLYHKLKSSPYRNYMKGPVPPDTSVVYFMLLAPTEKLTFLYDRLKQDGFCERLKIVLYDASDYPGCSYLKIYNKNVSRKNMTAYLQQMTGLTTTVTFSTIEKKADYLIRPDDPDQVVRLLQKLYEPPAWKKN